MNKPICPHCGEEAVLKDSSFIYGKSYGNVWVCFNYPQCNSFVGCHGYTAKPLGTLANSDLRNKRKETHSLFDQLWKGKNRQMHRGQAYKWMAEIMNLSSTEAHIGMMNINQCKKLIQFCKQKLFKQIKE